MKTYDDLSKEKKMKFNALYSMKTLMEIDYKDTISTSLFLTFMGLVSAFLIIFSTVALSFLSIYLSKPSLFSTAQSTYNIGLIVPLLFIFIGFIYILIGVYRRIQDKKLLFLIFGTNSMIEDEIEITREDYKKVKESWKKVK